MDFTTAVVLVVILFALILVGAFAIYRRRVKADLQGPFGVRLKLDASDEAAPPPPAIQAQEIESRSGGLVADDQTGRGVDVKQVKVEDDVLLSSTDADAPASSPAGPKADPPT